MDSSAILSFLFSPLKTTCVSSSTWKAFTCKVRFNPENSGITVGKGMRDARLSFNAWSTGSCAPRIDGPWGSSAARFTGMSYQPSEAEDPTHPRNLRSLLRRLYREFATEHPTVVAYKGGTVEKTLLSDAGLPGLNLESLGCPKYDVLRGQDLLRDRREDLLPSCGFHADPTHHHCPETDCHALSRLKARELLLLLLLLLLF